jgi:hypothetical protein
VGKQEIKAAGGDSVGSVSRRDSIKGGQSAVRRTPFRRGVLLLTGVISAYAVGGPDGVKAQMFSGCDPICRAAHLSDSRRATADDAAMAGSPEYNVKAAMLYRCLELVHWPADASAAKEPTLTIGVLGKNALGESLNCLAGKSISGRKLMVKRLSRPEEAAGCQSVFVGASEKKRTAKILKELTGLPLLTVGEAPGFVEQGGIINLLVERRHVRLELNTAAAEKAGIGIDPELMKLVPVTGEQR